MKLTHKFAEMTP